MKNKEKIFKAELTNLITGKKISYILTNDLFEYPCEAADQLAMYFVIKHDVRYRTALNSLEQTGEFEKDSVKGKVLCIDKTKKINEYYSKFLYE